MISRAAQQFVTAYAICAASGTYEYPTSSITVANGTQQMIGVDCPGTAKVVGGGVEVTATGGPDEFEVAATFPSDGLDGNTKFDDNWTASASNLNSGAPLDMDLYAVCKDV